MNKLTRVMQELNLTPAQLLDKINAIAERDIRREAIELTKGIENEDIRKQERDAYIHEKTHRKARGNHGIHNVVSVSRKTLYTAMYESDCKLSARTANLILDAINEIRRSRDKKRLTLDDIGITVFKKGRTV